MFKTILTAAAAIIASLALPALAQDSFKDLALPEVWQGEKETVFGPMQFDHGMPLRESAEMLYDKLDAYRATELFLWSQPIVSFAIWRDQAREKHENFQNRSTLHVKTYDDRVGVLTINQSSEYFFSFVNTDDDATVIEIPPGIVVGLVTDFWQRGLTDLGVFSLNAGSGGTYVLSGPTRRKTKSRTSRARRCLVRRPAMPLS
ncbi:DUF1254 domain-containing protein [Roseibium alexandrii]|uniref:DUF1254 domain-containing protein n=1 Tax=Roseibium alexandrii TaxID=388408 RepID=UPI003752F4C9